MARVPFSAHLALWFLAQGSVGYAQYDKTAFTQSREIEFKPFSISATPVLGYDFNANAGTSVFAKSPQQQNQNKTETASSAYAGANGSGAINLVYPDTFFGSRMSLGYIYYFNSDVHDQNRYPINVDSTLSHTFSPRWILSAHNSFVSETGQQIGNNTALPNQAQQYYRSGTYYTDTLSINNSFLLGPQLTFNTTLTYGMTRYEDDYEANVYDRDEYGISMGPNYLLNSNTSVGFSVGYNRSEHPGPTKIFSTVTNIVVLVDRVSRNTETESLTVNMTHVFSSRFTMGGSVGVTFTSFQDGNVTGDSVNPFVSVAATYIPSEKSTVQLSYVHSITEAQIPEFTAAIQDTATASLMYQLLPKIPLTIQATYSQSHSDQEFNAATAATIHESGREEAISFGVSTGYSITSFASVNISYLYTHVMSTFSTRSQDSYDSDQLSFNFNVRF